VASVHDVGLAPENGFGKPARLACPGTLADENGVEVEARGPKRLDGHPLVGLDRAEQAEIGSRGQRPQEVERP
jgi:hypothetical protein